jgi:hypothetical protein
MPDWLYDSGPSGIGVFALITLFLGGGAAWITGRAIAQTWRPYWHVPMYIVPLSVAVRFLHFALFEAPLLSGRSFVTDYVILLVLASLGYRTMRAQQFATQYSWLFARKGPFWWGRKAAS